MSDTLFILDATSAIGLEKFVTVKETLQEALQKLTFPDDRIAFIPFGFNPYLISFNYFPTDYIDSPIDKLRFLDGDGYNVQSLGPQIDAAIKERKLPILLHICMKI